MCSFSLLFAERQGVKIFANIWFAYAFLQTVNVYLAWARFLLLCLDLIYWINYFYWSHLILNAKITCGDLGQLYVPVLCLHKPWTGQPLRQLQHNSNHSSVRARSPCSLWSPTRCWMSSNLYCHSLFFLREETVATFFSQFISYYCSIRKG